MVLCHSVIEEAGLPTRLVANIFLLKGDTLLCTKNFDFPVSPKMDKYQNKDYHDAPSNSLYGSSGQMKVDVIKSVY